MNVYELDTSWVAAAKERRLIYGELLGSHEVRAIFVTSRDDVLAVLFSGDRRAFDAWARTLEPNAVREEVRR